MPEEVTRTERTPPSSFQLLARFAASSTSVFCGLLAALAVKSPRALGAASVTIVALEVAMIVAGYAITNYWLPRRGKTIPGTVRSHVMAGLGSPLVLGALSTLVQGTGTTAIAVLSAATGTTLALARWLVTRRPPREPRPTLEEREQAADLALARALDEVEGARDVIPLQRPERDRQARAHVA